MNHRQLTTPAEFQSALQRMADQLQTLVQNPQKMAFIGIRTHGVPLADRLKKIYDQAAQVNVPMGILDITLYRDDYDLRGVKPRIQSSQIRFGVDDMELVLVDDVLFTGRTIRAAIEALGDYGRPRAIRLAVLADRGHRELPIQPDVVGVRLEVGPHDRIRVHTAELDGCDQIVLEERGYE